MSRLVDLELQPRTARRDDLGGVDVLVGGLVGRALEVDAGRADELRHDDTLGAVDDEGALVGHEREVAHEDRLGLDLAGLVVHELGGDEQRRGVGEVLVRALLDGVLRRLEPVVAERQRHRAAEVLDRGDLLEDVLEARGRRGRPGGRTRGRPRRGPSTSGCRATSRRTRSGAPGGRGPPAAHGSSRTRPGAGRGRAWGLQTCARLPRGFLSEGSRTFERARRSRPVQRTRQKNRQRKAAAYPGGRAAVESRAVGVVGPSSAPGPATARQRAGRRARGGPRPTGVCGPGGLARPTSDGPRGPESSTAALCGRHRDVVRDLAESCGPGDRAGVRPRQPHTRVGPGRAEGRHPGRDAAPRRSCERPGQAAGAEQVT